MKIKTNIFRLVELYVTETYQSANSPSFIYIVFLDTINNIRY